MGGYGLNLVGIVGEEPLADNRRFIDASLIDVEVVERII